MKIPIIAITTKFPFAEKFISGSRLSTIFQITDDGQRIIRVVSANDIRLAKDTEVVINGKYYKKLRWDEFNLDDAIVLSGLRVIISDRTFYGFIIAEFFLRWFILWMGILGEFGVLLMFIRGLLGVKASGVVLDKMRDAIAGLHHLKDAEGLKPYSLGSRGFKAFVAYCFYVAISKKFFDNTRLCQSH